MERLGTLIYTNSWEYQVMAIRTKDMSSKRMAVDMYTVSPDGQMSDIITVTRKDFYRKSGVFDFFYDMEGDFTRTDIDTIRAEMMDVFGDDTKVLIVQSKATLEEIHRAVSEYIIDQAEELEDNPDADVFIKDGYGYILPTYMELFVKSSKQLGYTKRIDILKRLKIMGALHHGNNRPYDILISRNGKKQRFYKIELADQMSDEQADEVV